MNCNDQITVYALLTPSTVYDWVITDKFGNEFEGTTTTDVNGFPTIEVADLPDGLLQSFSGDFEIEFFKHGLDCIRQRFLMARYYEKIRFSVKPGTRVDDTIGCPFVCDTDGGGGSGTNSVFIFTNVSTYNIIWTALLATLLGNAPTVQVYIQTSPGIYQLSVVSVNQVRNPGDDTLTEIDIDLGGNATGYVIVSG